MNRKLRALVDSIRVGIALILVVQTSHARETELGTVIHEQDDLEVTVPVWASGSDSLFHPSPEHWCADAWRTQHLTNKDNYRVYVRYDVANVERERLMGPDYEAFVRTKIYPALIGLCGPIDVSSITMDMGRKGQSSWDTLILSVAQDGQSVTRSDYYPSKLARANMTLAEIEAMLPTTPAAETPRTRGEQLFRDDRIAIYGREAVWCHSANFRSDDKPSPDSGGDVIVPVALSTDNII